MCTFIDAKKSVEVFIWAVNFGTKPGVPLKPVSEGGKNQKNEQFCLSAAQLREFIAS